MRRLAAITAIVGGLLLILVPRYILPACEYEGYAPMHCSDTARAEIVAGGVLMIVGLGMFFLKKRLPHLISVCAAIMVYGVSYWLPDKFGYCMSPRMPCHYGMVPGVRFVAVIGLLIMVIALIGLVKSYRTKGNS